MDLEELPERAHRIIQRIQTTLESPSMLTTQEKKDRTIAKANAKAIAIAKEKAKAKLKARAKTKEKAIARAKRAKEVPCPDSEILSSFWDFHATQEAKKTPTLSRNEIVETIDRLSVANAKAETAKTRIANQIEAKARFKASKELGKQALKEKRAADKSWMTATEVKALYSLQPTEGTIGQKLAAKSRELGIEKRIVPDVRYPTGVGIYSIAVIEAVLIDLVA